MLPKASTLALLTFATGLFSTYALADPFTLVYTDASNTVVKEILNLTIDGTTYNVTFGDFRAFDSTFVGNVSGAADAANAINAALNTSTTAALVTAPNFGSGSVGDYTVIDTTLGGGLGIVSEHTAGWQILLSGLDIGSTALFQKVAVPEPASAVLLVSAVAGILLLRS